jgi:two-component system CheB/CheR fusion protein
MSGPLATLTLREREVLLMLVEGHSSKVIARALRLSPRTVECHRNAIRRKTKAQSPIALARLALLFQERP